MGDRSNTRVDLDLGGDSLMPISASEQSNYSRIEQLSNRVTQASEKWLVLDSNTLDGSFHPLALEEGLEVGYGGTSISDENGDLAQPIKIEIPISEQLISVVDVYGNDKLEQWPTALTITLLLADQPVARKDFTQSTLSGSHDFGTSYNCDRIAIEVTKVNKPNVTVKLLEIIAGVRMLVISGGIQHLQLDQKLYVTNYLDSIDQPQGVQWQERSYTRNIHDVLWAPSRQTYCKVQIHYRDVEDEQLVHFETSSPLTQGMDSQWLFDGQTQQNFKNLFLDGDCTLDGSYHPLDVEYGNVPVGLEQMSNDQGYFDPPIVITIEFPRLVLKEFLFYTANMNGQYLRDFDAEAFLDGVSVKKVEIENNQVSNWRYPLPNIACDKVVYTVRRINQFNRVLKIMELYTAIVETYYSDEIISVDILEESGYQSSNLPIGNVSSNQLNLSVINLLGKYSSANAESPFKDMLTMNREIKVWFGAKVFGDEIEWHRMGTFWSEKWRASRTTLEASTTAYDRLYQLRERVNDKVHINKNLYDITEWLLQDAGVDPENYIIEDKLKNYVFPYFWFGKVTHFQALARIAKLSLCNVYCDRYDIIRIEDRPRHDQPLVHIGADRYQDFKDLNGSPGFANDLSCAFQGYEQLAEGEVFRDDNQFIIPAGETLELEYAYSTVPVVGNVTMTLTASPAGLLNYTHKDYTWGTEVTIENPSTQNVTVSLIAFRGVALQKVGVPTTLMKTNKESIAEYGTMSYVFQDELVQDMTTANRLLTEIITRYGTPQKWMSIISKGDFALPAEFVISAPAYDNEKQEAWYRMKRNRMRWDGALSMTQDVLFERRIE